MTAKSTLGHESSAVQKHLEIMQGVITRMAENSRFCKVWCVALVSAVLILVARTDTPQYALIALIPAALFLILDTYYLALERAFRGSYNPLVRKLNEAGLEYGDLYVVAPSGSVPRHFIACLGSFSIWPFYLALALMIALAYLLLGTAG